MATGLESRKASAVETQIERQITDTCKRIRLFDAGASLLLLGSVVLAYAIAFAIFDLATQGVDAGWVVAVRWSAFAVFVGLGGALAIQVLRRLTRRVNPYYAARRLEETVPDAKNSVINWLDLREEKLAPLLRRSLGGKAADDLKEANPEHAIDRKLTWVLGGVFTLLLLGMLVLMGARSSQFFSLMQRAFLPFQTGQLASRVRITVLRPESGVAVVTEKQAVAFSVQIEGMVPEVNQPGAPALLYRYQPGDKFVAQFLQPDDNGHWITRMLPDQVGSTGFWYKIKAGDAETPLYQIAVRAQPLVLRYEITYKYRPYLNLPPETVVFEAALPFVKRHRGTEVTLVVRTNRLVQQGGVKLVTGKAKKDLRTEVLKDDAQAFQCQWTLEQSGDFFVSFTSSEGEAYLGRTPCPVDVLVDATPTVELTRPKQNVEMPANGTLEVEGVADDDLGLKALTLRLELLDGGQAVPLKPLPYRPGVPLDLDGKGTFPVHLEYLDHIKLDELRTAEDQLANLRTGSIVRYWLEATDNSDYPTKTGNVGKSQAYEIKIQPPQDEAIRDKAREQAEDKQKKHNKEQDQKLAQDKKDKEDRDARQNGKPSRAEQEKADEQKKSLDEQRNNLDKQNASPDKGEAKGNEPDRAQSKEGAGDGDGTPSPQQKDQKPGDPNQAGNSKDAEQPAGADNKPGQSKDAGNPKPNGNDNQPNGGQPQSDPMKGASKSETPKESPGQGKDEGSAQGEAPSPSQAKSQGPDAKMQNQTPQAKGADTGQDAPSAQSKPGGDGSPMPETPDQPAQGVAKADEAQGQKSISKEKGSTDAKQSLDPDLQAAAKKNPGEVVGAGQADAKPPPSDQSKEGPGVAKDDGQRLKDGNNRKPTPEDVAYLKDLMKHEGGLGDLAANALTEMSKGPDPEIRKLAQEALDQAGRKPGPSEKPHGPNDPSSVADKPPIGKPKGPETKGNSGQKPGIAAQTSDEGKGDSARKDLARFGGNLQLEDFIKRATPEYRAKAGINEDDWQRFLAQSAEYDALLRKMEKQAKKTPLDGRGTAGTFIGSGPKRVQGSQDAVDPLSTGQAQIPPELLDAQRRFRDR